MITDTNQSNQLPNNDNQIFKSVNSDKTLILNSFSVIARKEDGYINLNQLCKAGGKDFRKWKRNDKSKAFLEALKASDHLWSDTLIKYVSGSNDERTNWGHPQVAINVAQWISPVFDVKVSKWVYELFVFGKVELGNEKTNDELEEKFREQITGNSQKKRMKNLKYSTNTIPAFRDTAITNSRRPYPAFTS
jgi:hypothetical protein